MFDDQYTDGMWYDMATGEIECFKWGSNRETVVICDINGDEVDEVEAEDIDPVDLVSVSDEAINDPVQVVEDELNRLRQNNTISSMNPSAYADLKYAREMTEIVEQ